MQIKIVAINIVMFLLSGILLSQSMQDVEFVTNLSIYSKLLDKNLESVENQMVLLGSDKVYCAKINAKPETDEFLYIKIRQRLNNFKIVSSTDSLNADYIVEFGNVYFKTNYTEVFGSLLKHRLVKRIIQIGYDFEIKSKGNDSLIKKNNVKDSKEDEFMLDRLEDVERGGYEFLKGVLPEQSFWDKAIIPGIVAVTSAVAIILFFIIRSK